MVIFFYFIFHQFPEFNSFPFMIFYTYMWFLKPEVGKTMASDTAARADVTLDTSKDVDIR